jgi:hypothetical protein
LNFNKLLAEIIPSGVSFSTKELFDFVETVGISEVVEVIVQRRDRDYFGNPIKFNGAIKFDGHTVNNRVSAKGKYNGVFKFNGDLKFSGIGTLPSPYQPTAPFKFSSGIVDKLAVTLTNENHDGSMSDQAEMNEIFFAGMRKHHHFNGAYKFDGSIKFDGMVLIPLG